MSKKEVSKGISPKVALKNVQQFLDKGELKKAIEFIDFKGQKVTLSENNILRIKEENPHMESGEDV